MPKESKKIKEEIFGVFNLGKATFYGREIKKRKPGELKRIALFSSQSGRVPKRQMRVEALLETEIIIETLEEIKETKEKCIRRRKK
jgi:hypothetical protein